jgi:hypothetical protein
MGHSLYVFVKFQSQFLGLLRHQRFHTVRECLHLILVAFLQIAHFLLVVFFKFAHFLLVVFFKFAQFILVVRIEITHLRLYRRDSLVGPFFSLGSDPLSLFASPVAVLRAAGLTCTKLKI